MALVSCPHCGFQNFDISSYCGRCELALTIAQGVVAASESAVPPPPPLARPRMTMPQEQLSSSHAPPAEPVSAFGVVPMMAPRHVVHSKPLLEESSRAGGPAAAQEIMVEIASWWRQAFGRLVDATIFVGILALVVSVEMLLFGFGTPLLFSPQGVAQWLAQHLDAVAHGSIAALVFMLVYGFEGGRRSGRTLGRMLTGTVLVRVSGRPLGTFIIALRTLASLFSLLFLGAGYLWIVVDPMQRTWHDMVAGTVVVNRKVRMRS